MTWWLRGRDSTSAPLSAPQTLVTGWPILQAMRAGKSDTPKELEGLIVRGYQRMTPKEKLERVRQLNRSLHTLALAGIRQRHGADLSERELRLHLAALSIDRETMIQAFGWDPDEHGL